MKLGAEAEFVLLEGDKILSPAHYVLSPWDIVGVDGHESTVEVRSDPGGCAKDVFNSIAERLSLYKTVIQQAQANRKLPSRLTLARAGAYCGAPLGAHIHFSGLPVAIIEPLIRAMELHLLEGMLHPCISKRELNFREGSEYGRRGNIFANDLRLKGEDGWFEWRRPYSCLLPSHFATLLLGAEILTRTGMLALPFLKEVTRRPPTPEIFGEIAMRLPSLTARCASIAKLYTYLQREGVVDWALDVIPIWEAR